MSRKVFGCFNKFYIDCAAKRDSVRDPHEKMELDEMILASHLDFMENGPDICEFEDLIGMTIVDVSGKIGDEELTFLTKEGYLFRFYHAQGCCEEVYVEDIWGDLADIIDSPITIAEESSSEGTGTGNVDEEWTFYKIGTNKGSITIRWYGGSNGNYSVNVDLEIEKV